MLTLLALLPLCIAQDPQPAPIVDWAELLRRFQADAVLLQKSGTPLDLAALKVEKIAPGDLAREIGKRETEFFGEGWYEMLWMLAHGFGLKADATADAFKVTFQRNTTGPLPARYFPARKAVVIDESQYTQDGRFDRALLHALALASLDQQPGGLAALHLGTSTEESLCDRAFIEGRAETAVRSALGEGPREELSALELRTGGFALVELAGEAWIPRSKERPTSGRALLHGPAVGAPGTLALDALAPPGTKLLREDTLGELGLLVVLSMAGAHPVRALEAGIGLTADKLRLWKYGERDRAFAWRFVFASEGDALELDHLLAKIAHGTRVQHAHVIDWCFSTRPELEAQLTQALSGIASPPAASAAEAGASARLQEQILALQPHLHEGRWLLPEFDLAWKLPEGWKPSFFDAQAIVYLGAPEEGFRDNLTFREYALPPDATPEQVLAGARRSFDGLSDAKLVRAELALTPAGEGVLVEFTQSNAGKELHQLELQLVQPGRKRTVTATVLAKHWKDASAGVEALLRATEHVVPPSAPEPRK